MGKLIILSFSDDEEKALEELISGLSAISGFSTLSASEDAPLLMNSLEIYPQQHLVRLFGMPVKLTPMEFDILLLLARRSGQVFSARQIYEFVAAESFDTSWTGISSMIYKLRRKLGADIIETVWGHGYRLRIKK